jgi:hypothetical protein
MTDELIGYGFQTGGAFDDDRLLACALGLDDDPERLAAAEADAGLAARLAAMRADVAVVETQVAAAVPAPDDGYADLGDARWSGLKEYFEPPAGAARPRRAGRWWRIAAPVTALAVLALVVGIVAVGGESQYSVTGGSADGPRVVSADAPETATDKAPGSGTAAERVADQLDRFAVVVLARASEARGALQDFAVVRIFKGKAPEIVQLVVDGRPADRGRLHLLLLDPWSAADDESLSPSTSPATPAPASEAGLPGEPLDVAYTYLGEPTVVHELAAGTDPATVALPVP